MSFRKKVQPEEAIDPPKKEWISIADVSYGDYGLIDGHPCKITKVELLETFFPSGTVTGINLLTNKEVSKFEHEGGCIQLLTTEWTEYQLIGIESDGFVIVMDENGTIREDLKLLEGEVNERIRKSFDADKSLVVSVLTIYGKEVIMDFKEKSQRVCGDEMIPIDKKNQIIYRIKVKNMYIN